MSGKIIYEPPRPTACDRGACAGMPPAEDYRDGARWRCDDCGAIWEKRSGAQFVVRLAAWMRVKSGGAA